MSNSQFVCWLDGIPLSSGPGDSWRHALGGRTGSIPAHRRHKPVPCARTEYERFASPDTPLPEARAIKATMDAIAALVAAQG